MKTRLTTALLDKGSWLRRQLWRPFCCLFGHDYWTTLGDTLSPPIYHCRQCGKYLDKKLQL